MPSEKFLRGKVAILAVTWAATYVLAGEARGAPALRKQVSQTGDFIIFGNTVGLDCSANPSLSDPDVVGNCGTSHPTNNNAVDVFWRSDAPADGKATADIAVAQADARSTAMLNLPAGATVTYARIYWASILGSPATPDDTIYIERPGDFTEPSLKADDMKSFTRTGPARTWYQSTAEITALVAAHGAGAYRVGGIDSLSFRDLDEANAFIAWAVVVFYQLSSEPPRNLALFDSFDMVGPGAPASATISGFLVPNAGFDAKLGVLAYEGDNVLTGDSLSFNAVKLSNAQNSADNFFNGTRSYLGSAVSTPGDLPLLTGAAATMSGIDIDVVDITARVGAGDTQANFSATSDGDVYALGAFVTSISTLAPDLSTSNKSFTNLTGGSASLRPGDTIEYTVFVSNTGNDGAADTVVSDPLPAGISYVPGSLRITQGAGAGDLSDRAGDDQGEYVAATRTLVVRVGAGASASQGGTLEPGESATIVFHATIDADANGTIANQAIIRASGARGAPAKDYVSDGNGPAGAGAPPTTFSVQPCSDDPVCTPPLVCETSKYKVCVECTPEKTANCSADARGAVCFAATSSCGCQSDADCSVTRLCDMQLKQCVDGNGKRNPSYDGTVEGGGFGCRASGGGAIGAHALLALLFLARRRVERIRAAPRSLR